MTIGILTNVMNNHVVNCLNNDLVLVLPNFYLRKTIKRL